jgi:hypothetical protein
VHTTCQGGSDRLEPAVWVLGEAGDAVAVVHAVRCCGQVDKPFAFYSGNGGVREFEVIEVGRTARVEVCAVALARCLHLGVPRRVVVDVVHLWVRGYGRR